MVRQIADVPGNVIENAVRELNKAWEYPYRVSETLFLYLGNDVILPNKRKLRRLFPEKKAEMAACFMENRSFSDSLEEALALLSRWAVSG